MLRKFKITFRIQFIFALLFIMFGALLFEYWNSSGALTRASAQEIRTAMLHEEEQKIEVATIVLAQSLATQLATVQDDAQRRALIQKAFDAVRFEEDKSGYFYAYRGTTCFAHGTSPNLVGKDLGSLKGPDGSFLIRDLERVAQNGGGTAEFPWQKPGEGVQPKIGSAMFIPGTDIWIGTGVYLSNIDGAQRRLTDKLTDVVRPRILMTAGIFGGVLLLLVLPLTLLTARSILRPLSQVVGGAKRIADGGLDVRLDEEGRDELAELMRAMNAMAAKLQTSYAELETAMGQAREEARTAAAARNEAEHNGDKLQESHEEILRTAQILRDAVAKGSEVMATVRTRMAALDRKSDGQQHQMAEIAQAMDSLSEAARFINGLGEEAVHQGQGELEVVKRGVLKVETSVTAIEAVHAKADTLRDEMGVLERHADAINKVMEVISDIADQTNLLALNAAIEAARAGDAGRGFAVVADEVRKLAEKTMAATKEVGTTISGIQQSAQANAQAMSDIASDITRTAAQAQESGQDLTAIARGAETASERSSRISKAAEEQAVDTRQVAATLQAMNELVGEAKDDVQGSNKAVTVLSDIMTNLETVIANLQKHAKLAG